jgi:hypothetical protein
MPALPALPFFQTLLITLPPAHLQLGGRPSLYMPLRASFGPMEAEPFLSAVYGVFIWDNPPNCKKNRQRQINMPQSVDASAG